MKNVSSFIVTISSPSGGGKTEITKSVAKRLIDANSLFFDEYDDVDNIHPDSFYEWLKGSRDVNEWSTPQLASDMRLLKNGLPIKSVTGNGKIQPKKYTIVDYPFGNIHKETMDLIDLSVFIDTPLDVAMARRFLRDYSDFTINNLKSIIYDLNCYLKYSREAFLVQQKKIKPRCDFIVDGSQEIKLITENIVKEIRKKVLHLRIEHR